MATNELPPRPNLAQLRTRAKELLRAARAGDPVAVGRLQAQLAGRPIRLQLAEAQWVIAREHGFASWTRLKIAVAARAAAAAAGNATSYTPLGGSEPAATAGRGAAAPGRIGRPTRRHGPRHTPGRAAIQALHAAVVAAAGRGEAYPFLFAPPIGPLPRAVQAPLRQALVDSGQLPLVVDVLRQGAEQPSARVRAECAHALDWLGDSGCLPTLLRLADDPVPRVRWFALHALACDDCKLEPLSAGPAVVPLLRAKAASDPNARVRRQAEATLRLLGQT